MNNSAFLEARTSRVFPFSAERVFDAWLDPATLGKWMFGPAVRDEEVVSIEVDPKVGGEFSFLVRRQNMVVDHIGSYLKIERPSKLEFKWGVKGMSDSSRVIVTIAPHDAGCEVTVVHELDPSWHEYLERSVHGWAQMLSVLEAALKAAG
ncbi:MAG: SRPBCC domain-containing protein [Proteobacteria bacterium]|nr:SRPBCC domain-containing protein [Pseudomonadota bacterium]